MKVATTSCIFGCVLIWLMCIPNSSGLTGHVCYISKTIYQSYQSSRQVSYASKYTSKCGLFGWDRCTRYRTRHRTEYYKTVRTLSRRQQQCCKGWRVDSSGNHCNIHNKPPTVSFCPPPQTVQATAPTAYVTWQSPTFREPYKFDLAIASAYDLDGADLPWGDTTITYTATSSNNNMQATCTFKVNIIPAIDHPVIANSNGNAINVEEDVPTTLECWADHGYPPFQLYWTIDGSNITQGTSYTVEPYGYRAYKNAISRLQLTPSREQDGMELVCHGVKSGRQEQDAVILNVAYDPDVIVDHCPNNRSVASFYRSMNISFVAPQFSDINDDPIDVKCNHQGTQELSHGYRHVYCEAQNRVTHRKANCSYTLSILAARCPPLAPPIGGAVVCGNYNKEQVVMCQYMCDNDKDVSYEQAGQVPQVIACSLAGTWTPKTIGIKCSDERGFVDYMPSPRHYLPSTCDESDPDQLLEQNFMEVVSRSHFKTMCDHSVGCQPDTVTIACYNNKK